MSCYHPVCGFWLTDPATGETEFKYTRLPYDDKFNFNEVSFLKGKEAHVIGLPCGKCIGCRLDYSRQWANRMMLEYDHTKKAVFLTMTIDDEHMNYNSAGAQTTDISHDVPSFNKRLRYYFSDSQIRFYAVSEYGSKTYRPHYHGVYFGLDIHDFDDLRFWRLTRNKQPIYVSDKLSRIWGKGMVFIGAVSWQSCAYVARYNLKKLRNVPRETSNVPRETSVEPERSLMSRRPGIGGYFLEDNPDFIESFQQGVHNIPVRDENGLKVVSSVNVPKSVLNRLGILCPDAYNVYKSSVRQAAHEGLMNELSGTDLRTLEYLEKKEGRKLKAIKSLRREAI